MKLTISTLLILLSIIGSKSYAQWANQNSGVTGEFSDVFFVNTQVGFATTAQIGQNYLLKTTDGGNSWSQLLGNSNQGSCIFFTSVDTGYRTKGPALYMTNDGGTTWTFITNFASGGFTLGIDFPSIAIGYAATSAGANGPGLIHKTTNQGITWTNITPTANVPYRSISFTSNDTGYVVGNLGYIQRTVDGGATWTTQNSGTTTYLNSVYFRPHSKNGWIGGGLSSNSGIILMTNNGVTWSNVTPTSCPPIFSISFADDNHGYAVGYSGVIYKTTDGGITWTQDLGPSSTLQLNAVHFLDINHAWAVGTNGMIKKISTTVEINETEYNKFSIYPNPSSSTINLAFGTFQTATTIKLMDVTGKEIESQKFTGTQFTFDRNNLESGIYIIQSTNSKKESNYCKLIVE